MTSLLLGFALALASCGGAAATPPSAESSRAARTESRPETERRMTPRRTPIDLEDVDGLSGLTIDDQGVFWAVPERNHVLVAFRDAEVLAVVRLEGFPEEADAESIAHLGDGRFAIGTESTDETRSSDQVYLVELEGELPDATARVTSQVELPYAVLSVSPAHNKGIEGLCAVGETLVAAVEPKLAREDGTCTTSVARGDLASGSWTGHDLELTTETGKISALACRSHPAGIEVFAVERHYEVMRILRFVVPNEPNDAPIAPELVLDLAGTLDGNPNLEGLALDGSELVMINDNHYGERTGPNEEFRIATRDAP